MEDMKVYLEPTVAIESGHPLIIEKARSLTEGCISDRERAVRLFHFVRDSIEYSIYVFSMELDDLKASVVLERGRAYCVQKAVLLAAMGRASGIPSRMAFAAIRNHRMPPAAVEMIGSNIAPFHGYNQFYIEGKWVSATATFNRKICEQIRVPVVEFDGVHDAILPSRDLDGNPYIEYVEKFGSFADLPLKMMVEKESRGPAAPCDARLNFESI